MSTRGMIARPLPDGSLEGRYHHFDSYPRGLGKALWDHYHGWFAQYPEAERVAHMQAFFIDAHPAGWSTVVETNLALEPGFDLYHYKLPKDEIGPQCYCHGKRSEEESTFRCLGSRCDGAGCNPLFIEWAYALHPEGLQVYASVERNGGYVHVPVTEGIHWDGNEPDWGAIERP